MVRTFQLGRRATTPTVEDETAAAVASPESDARAERTDGTGTDTPAAVAAPAREEEPAGLSEARPVGSGTAADAAGDTPDSADPADGATDTAGGSRRSPESGAAPGTRMRRGVLAAFVLMLVAAVVTGILWNTGRAAEADRSAALDAAEQAAVSLTSINFETAEDDVRRVVEESTGDFGGLFEQNLDSYISLVKESKIETRGEITGAGIDHFDGNTARVVLAVKADVSNQSVPDGEPRFYRMVTEVEKKDGEWLVSRVEFVP